MIANVLQSIGGVEVFPIVAMLAFMAVLVMIVIRVVRMDSHLVQKMSRLPLGSQTEEDEEVAGGR